ncbi:hypothetical protein [Burkholderia ubonensis]|uniref:hypothetical protein n=1 Tax=Burkholderia ubonensis TaxID=101571 RepID=UPI00075A7D2B|nr:hypothetical protein [Burkholderia ubonensis]KVV07448.1 hypothetical protein WK77_16820 [Burkholderia ubonensis]
MNASLTETPLTSDEVLIALSALGEDPNANRVDAVRALIDPAAAALYSGDRAEIVRRAVHEARKLLDSAPKGIVAIQPEPRTHVEIATFGRSGIGVAGGGPGSMASRLSDAAPLHINVRQITAELNDPEDAGVAGVYAVIFSIDDRQLSDAKRASIALDIFHARQGIGCLDDFEIAVIDGAGNAIAQDLEHEDYSTSDDGDVEKISCEPLTMPTSQPRLFVGNWLHTWSWYEDGRAEVHCRVVVDVANEKLIAAQVADRGQWANATEDQQKDLAASLFIEHKVSADPKAHDLLELDRLPKWAAAMVGGEIPSYRDGEVIGFDHQGNAIEWNAGADMPVESGLTRDMILLAKRSAMGRFFFVPSAEDDDDGFDRLMSMQSIEDIATSSSDRNGWGHIFLADHWQGHQLTNIQKWVFKDAARLIATMCGVSPEVAIEHIQKHRTTHAPNDNRTRIGEWEISLSPSTNLAPQDSVEPRSDPSTPTFEM